MLRAGVRVVVSNIRSRGSTLIATRMLATSHSSPLGEGRLEFQTARYPSFWSRLKQQKQGLGNMALSASIAFLAVSIIRQEKELTQAVDTSRALRKQNESLKEKLEDLKSVLEKGEQGEKTRTEVMTLLSEMLDLTGKRDAHELPGNPDNTHQTSPGSTFMV